MRERSRQRRESTCVAVQFRCRKRERALLGSGGFTRERSGKTETKEFTKNKDKGFLKCFKQGHLNIFAETIKIDLIRWFDQTDEIRIRIINFQDT